MKSKIRMIVLVFLILGILAITVNEIKLRLHDKKNQNTSETTEEVIDYSLYYSYSDVSKIVGYLADTEDKSQELSRLIDPLKKSEPVNAEYIKKIVSTIVVPDTVYKDELAGLSDEDYVTKEQFDAIYHNIADTGRVKGLSRKQLYIYGISGDNSDTVYDGVQTYTAEEAVSDEYLDRIVDAYLKNGKIFKINGYSDEQLVLENVWVKAVTDGKCEFLYDDIEKSYKVIGAASGGDADASESGYLADIIISNSGIVDIRALERTMEARVLGVVDGGLQVENKGTIPLAENFRAYDIYEIPICENSLQILSGYKKVSLYCEDGSISAAVVSDELVSDDIRVILSDSTYSSYDMEEVRITCDSAFAVDYPDEALEDETENENIVECDAGQEITIVYSDYSQGDIIKIYPREHNGRLSIPSIERTCGNPEYYGVLEIDIKSDSLNVINELPLEKYLYSVVSSEMPASNPDEALKAMAICARGYAYAKIKDGSFEEYNAHLDDTSLCQVYNNIDETPETVKAVKDTYGLVPTYNGAVIVPLYFSTSCGTTCTNEEIWGGSAYPYLESNVENLEKSAIDLSDEEDFIRFIDDSFGYNIIDKDVPYYRWYIDFTDEEITEAVNSTLEERISMSSGNNIRVLNEDGSYGSGGITDIGSIEQIDVTERSVSGVVMTLQIKGSEGTIEVSGQSNIRNLITPINQEIVRQDDSVVTGWTSLPSPYYYVEKTEGGYTIYGGGFGHGSGMSQNGAAALARAGNNYKYILRHYYSYIDFESIYDMADDAGSDDGSDE